MKEYYTTNEAATILKVTGRTLQTWDRNKVFEPDLKQDLNRLYSRKQLENRLGKRIEEATENPILNLTDITLNELYFSEEPILIDFAIMGGDTLKEKYEAIYVKLIEYSTVIHRKTKLCGGNFILASPEITSLFEIATSGFAPFHPNNDQLDKVDEKIVKYLGTINSRWRLYSSALLDPEMLFLGVRDADKILDMPGSRVSIKFNNYIL